MHLDELKRGLWGYRKDSVYRYIVAAEEKASARLAEKDAQLAKLDEQSRTQISELEAAVRTLREENAALKENQVAAFTALMEAQKYAEQLKADSDRRAQRAQEEFLRAVQLQNQKLDVYSIKIQKLRKVLKELLVEFDGRAEELENSLEFIQGQAPGPGFTVIRGNTEAQQEKEEQKDGSITPPIEEETWKKLLFM